MRINKSILAIGLTLCSSLFVGAAVAQPQPQAAPTSGPKTRPKATSSEPTKAPAVVAPTPLPVPAISHEFKVLSIDVLSGLDSLASAEMQRDLIYEPRLAEAEKLMNRAKYLAENDVERDLYPVAVLYLGQIVGCRAAVQIAENGLRLGAQLGRALQLDSTAIESAELAGQEQFSKDLKENSDKCTKDHKKVHDSIDSYIVRNGLAPNQPDKEEPRETKK